jgi:hypothetical protein
MGGQVRGRDGVAGGSCVPGVHPGRAGGGNVTLLMAGALVLGLAAMGLIFLLEER